MSALRCELGAARSYPLEFTLTLRGYARSHQGVGRLAPAKLEGPYPCSCWLPSSRLRTLSSRFPHQELLERVSDGVLADDRRAAMSELRVRAAESALAQAALGAMGLPVLLTVRFVWPTTSEWGAYSDGKVAKRKSKVWHGATEHGP
jgi:hypothetical protein